MAFPDDLGECTGFEWDAGNADKNWHKHRVSQSEIEQVFFNRPVVVALAKEDPEEVGELREVALGRTNADRWLFVVFAVRSVLLRPISARDMTRGERRIYEQAIQQASK